jgi:hypothetical protein
MATALWRGTHGCPCMAGHPLCPMYGDNHLSYVRKDTHGVNIWEDTHGCAAHSRCDGLPYSYWQT